jgi:transcriptional regulator with XRE-family HTH domain
MMWTNIDGGIIMTIKEYRLKLAWSLTELGKRANLSSRTVSRIENGEAAYDYTVAAIANALSEGLGKEITIKDLDGVNIAER